MAFKRFDLSVTDESFLDDTGVWLKKNQAFGIPGIYEEFIYVLTIVDYKQCWLLLQPVLK